MSRQKTTFSPFFQEHPIQASDSMGSITNIVEGFHDRLHYMVNHHAQVSVMHMVVSMPPIDSSTANKIISDSLQGLKKNMQNNKTEVQIGWVREQENRNEVSTPGPSSLHYHVGVIADGSKTQSAISHTQNLSSLVAKKLNEDSCRVHYCEPKRKQDDVTSKTATAIKIRRNSAINNEQFDNALNYLSYFAKTNQKGHTPHRQREFGFTRLPSNLAD